MEVMALLLVCRYQKHSMAQDSPEVFKPSPAALTFTVGTRLCLCIVLQSWSFVLVWVAVKELKLSYYIGETLLVTTYSHYGNLI